MASAFQDQLGFGAGVLVVQAVGGSTPIRLAVLQDCSLNFDPDIKALHGQKRYALALAAGKTKTSIKAKYAGFRGRLLYDAFFAGTGGASLTTGSRVTFVDGELLTGVAGSATVANGATFVADQGVYVKWSGRPLVGYNPLTVGATGDYSVSTTGTYSFATSFTTADQNPTTLAVDLYISYTYTDATTGTKVIFGNPLMGTNPVFSATINMAYDGRSALWTFNRCVLDKMSFPTKLDDFVMNDFECQVAADIAGNLGELDTDL